MTKSWGPLARSLAATEPLSDRAFALKKAIALNPRYPYYYRDLRRRPSLPRPGRRRSRLCPRRSELYPNSLDLNSSADNGSSENGRNREAEQGLLHAALVTWSNAGPLLGSGPALRARRKELTMPRAQLLRRPPALVPSHRRPARAVSDLAGAAKPARSRPATSEDAFRERHPGGPGAMTVAPPGERTGRPSLPGWAGPVSYSQPHSTVRIAYLAAIDQSPFFDVRLMQGSDPYKFFNLGPGYRRRQTHRRRGVLSVALLSAYARPRSSGSPEGLICSSPALSKHGAGLGHGRVRVLPRNKVMDRPPPGLAAGFMAALYGARSFLYEGRHSARRPGNRFLNTGFVLAVIAARRVAGMARGGALAGLVWGLAIVGKPNILDHGPGG